jgi:hypothetical protein
MCSAICSGVSATSSHRRTLQVFDEPHHAHVVTSSREQFHRRIGARDDEDGVRSPPEQKWEDVVDEPDRTLAIGAEVHISRKD